MSDPLRDRIAAAMHRESLKRLGFDKGYDWSKVHPEVKARYLTDADAVITELGLREERRTNPMSYAGMTIDLRTGERDYRARIRYDRRYVTEWKADDE